MEDLGYAYCHLVGYCKINSIDEKSVTLTDLCFNEQRIIDKEAFNQLFSRNNLVTNNLIQLDINDNAREKNETDEIWNKWTFVEEEKTEEPEEKVETKEKVEFVEAEVIPPSSNNRSTNKKSSTVSDKINKVIDDVKDELTNDFKDLKKEFNDIFNKSR